MKIRAYTKDNERLNERQSARVFFFTAPPSTHVRSLCVGESDSRSTSRRICSFRLLHSGLQGISERMAGEKPEHFRAGELAAHAFCDDADRRALHLDFFDPDAHCDVVGRHDVLCRGRDGVKEKAHQKRADAPLPCRHLLGTSLHGDAGAAAIRDPEQREVHRELQLCTDDVYCRHDPDGCADQEHREPRHGKVQLAAARAAARGSVRRRAAAP